MDVCEIYDIPTIRFSCRAIVLLVEILISKYRIWASSTRGGRRLLDNGLASFLTDLGNSRYYTQSCVAFVSSLFDCGFVFQ